MKKVRDTFRQKVYNAERLTTAWYREADKLNTMDSIAKWIHNFDQSAWYKERFGDLPCVTLNDGRGRRCAGASAWTRTITLPKWSRTKIIILHELAHIVTHAKKNELQSHGIEFCTNYMYLVKNTLGYNDYIELRCAFKRNIPTWNLEIL